MADSYFSSLRSGARDVRDDAEDYGRRAAGSLRDTGERLRDQGDDARGELSRLWSDLEDLVERRIGPAASEAGRSASRYAYQGRDMAMDYADAAARRDPVPPAGGDRRRGRRDLAHHQHAAQRPALSPMGAGASGPRA